MRGERIEAAYVPRLSRKNGIPFFVTDNRDLPLYYVYLRETGDYLLVNEDSRSYSLGLQFLSSR